MRSLARRTRFHRGALVLGVVGLALVIASGYRAADASMSPKPDGGALVPLVLGALVGVLLVALAVVHRFSDATRR